MSLRSLETDTVVVQDAATQDARQRASVDVEQLHVRVIALENLVITLLAEGTELQRERARSMAAHVAPRPGFTRHRTTLEAATRMLHLIKRATFFRVASAPEPRAD